MKVMPHQPAEGVQRDPHSVEELLRGDLSREETRAVVRHLLTGCPDCSEELRPLLGQSKLPLPRARRGL